MRRTDGPFPIYEILPGQLYQRGKLHHYSHEKKSEGLLRYGITHVVSLAPPTPDLDLAMSDIEYVHLPIPDGILKEPSKVVLLDLANQLVEDGACVLTICNAGRNRSGLLSALIVREASGISGSAAMGVVRLHRPRALANQSFEAFLESLP